MIARVSQVAAMRSFDVAAWESAVSASRNAWSITTSCTTTTMRINPNATPNFDRILRFRNQDICEGLQRHHRTGAPPSSPETEAGGGSVGPAPREPRAVGVMLRTRGGGGPNR